MKIGNNTGWENFFRKVGDKAELQYSMKPVDIKGKRALTVGDTKSYLVKKNSETDKFELAGKIEKPVSEKDIRENYGLWKDSRNIIGVFKDGKIQNEEVKSVVEGIGRYSEGADSVEKVTGVRINANGTLTALQEVVLSRDEMGYWTNE